MKRYFYLCALAVVLCSSAVTAQSRVSSAFMPTCTNGAPWTVFVVDATDDTDCDTTPSGAAEAECRCLDGVIAAVTSGVGSGSDSFKTIDAPSGTDPVADSPTDTLTLTASGGLTITGDSAADSLAFVVGNVATASALAANPADCSGAANEFAQSIAASGALTCASVSFPNVVPASSAFTVDGAGSVWGASSSTLVFEGASADTSETILASGDPTGDRLLYLPDMSGGLLASTCSNCWADAASGLSAEAGVIVFEGSVADAHETRFFATNATADRYIEAPDATGYVLLSDCATCSGTAANSVQGTTNGFLFEGTTANGFETTFTAGNPTADRAIALPDETGTVVVTTGSYAAPYGEYDPDNPPTSVGTGGFSEEWANDTASVSWTWANQDSATETIELDGAVLRGETTAEEARSRWAAAATNADQTLTAKVIYAADGGTACGCQIMALITGTTATPTSIEYLGFADIGTDSVTHFTDTNYDTSAGFTSRGSLTTWTITDYSSQPVYLQFRYIDSTRAMTGYVSWDGKLWRQVSTAANVVSADPTNWAYSVRDAGYCRFEWVRLRTDANKDLAGE